MPSTHQSKSNVQYAARYRDGPRENVRMPELPKLLEGKFVRGQMYKYQDSLPSLPVPPLEQTLQKYIKGIKPLVSSEEYERTREIVEEFGKMGGVGEELQRLLLERAKTRENWLLDWWNSFLYYGYRKPLVVYSNAAAGVPFKAHWVRDKETFTKMAARVVIGLMKWSMMLENHALPPDVYRKIPQCMVQYDSYSKCRVPGKDEDISQRTDITKAKHIIVIRNGHFFKLDVFYECPDGTLALAPPTHIVKQLQAIMDTAPSTCEHPVGILTTEHRDCWYKTRQELLLDPINRASLEAIESAQGTFCLDKSPTSGQGESEGAKFKYWDPHKTMLANKYLHGNGSHEHSSNRWFDSVFQIMLDENGGIGANVEHSVGDGVTCISCVLFALDMLDICDVLTETSPVPEDSLKPFQPLDWNISLSVSRDIELAKEKMDKLAADVDLNVFTFTDFGKDVPKSFKLSPDGFIQNAILLTYYRMYDCMTAMHESGGTRMFRLGRTENIRNTTSQAYTFVRAMQDPNVSAMDKAKALGAAVKAHSEATVEALEGQGFDRHLLGLKIAAKEAGMDTPDIFTDPTYDKSLHFCLFTSQVPVPNHDMFLFFGPKAPDGYSICYNPQEKQILLSVSCFRSCPDTDSILFLKNMAENLSEMRDMLVAARELAVKSPH